MIYLKKALILGAILATPLSASAGGWAIGLDDYEITGQEQSQWCWAAVSQFTNEVMNLAEPIEQCELASFRSEWCSNGFLDCPQYGIIPHEADCCNDDAAASSSSQCNQPWFTPWQYYDWGLDWGGWSLRSTLIQKDDLQWEDITSRITESGGQVLNYDWGWVNGGGHIMAIVGWCDTCVGYGGSNTIQNYVKIYDPANGGSLKWISWDELLGDNAASEFGYSPHDLRRVYVDISIDQ